MQRDRAATSDLSESMSDPAASGAFELPRTRASWHGRRALVAIDDGTDDGCRTLLTELGLVVDVVPGTLDAVDAWMLMPYDLVLIDRRAAEEHRVPAAIRTLEALRGGRRTPIVIVESGPCADCLEADVDGVLGRFTVEEVCGMLREHVDAVQRPAPSEDDARASSAPIVDWDRLRDLGGADLSFARRILERFVAEAERLTTTAEAAACGDRNALIRALDSLKGTGANVGAPALSAVAAHVEAIAVTYGCEAAREKLPVVRAALEALRAECRRRL